MAAESLRLLRRGLSRSDGFSLFFAVCNSPADRDSFITSLAEALPDHTFHRVVITGSSTDPLEEVIRQAPSPPNGPVMLVDLEKAVPSSAEDHPVLQSINLRREEWPEKVPSPIVLWVPQYLLGLIGRTAPDFLDWRSDTVHLPALHGTAASAILGATWMGGTDARMPKEHRLERIRELESRLRAQSKTKDTVILTVHAIWLTELGNHHDLLGDFDRAEAMQRDALEINEKLGRKVGVASNYGNLGLIYRTRGELDQAEAMHRKALEINEKLGRLEGMANQYGNLGLVFQDRGAPDQAEAMLRKSLEINEKLGRKVGVASNYGNLGLIYQTRGELDQAEAMHRKALEINEKLGLLEGMANAYGNLGLIFRARGDLDQAEAMLRKSLEIDEKLGRLGGMANQYANLGDVFTERGDAAKAREYWNKSLGLYEKIGMPHMVSKVQGWLDGLGGESS